MPPRMARLTAGAAVLHVHNGMMEAWGTVTMTAWVGVWQREVAGGEWQREVAVGVWQREVAVGVWQREVAVGVWL